MKTKLDIAHYTLKAQFYNNRQIDNRLSNLFLCISGNAVIKFLSNEQTYKVSRGSWVILIARNSIQVKEMSPDFYGISICYNPQGFTNAELIRYIIPYIPFIQKHPILQLSESQFNWMQRYYELLIEKMEDGNNDSNENCYSTMLVALIIEMRNQYKAWQQSENLLPVSYDSDNQDRAHQIMHAFFNLLLDEYANHPSVESLAEKMCISPKHLTASVKRVTGKTAHQFIDEVIIFEAKNMLLSQQKTVQEIAYDLNFSNASFFGKYFKKHTGLTPNAFRNGNF